MPFRDVPSSVPVKALVSSCLLTWNVLTVALKFQPMMNSPTPMGLRTKAFSWLS